NKTNVAEKAGEESVQQYVIFPVWSFGSRNPQNTDGDAAIKVKKPEFEGRKPQSEIHVSPSSSAQTKKHDDKTKREAKGKIPGESLTGYRNLSAEFKDFSNETINEIYVDDIIFGYTNKDLCKAFEKLMKDKFQMSSIGELTLFLGLQVRQKKDGIFISQDKYVAEILRKFSLTDGKSASTPIDTEKPLLKYLDVKRIFRYLNGNPHLGLWYPKDSPFNLVSYLDSDYAGASLDRKSTIGGCQFLRCRLICWQCKKQAVMATSSTKSEYVVATSCYTQVLWI
nr:ribonuclease H-like domain, reverse transcriptase, RNA-dependent DNA polymerase [Tanacetum cinerariifolium]